MNNDFIVNFITIISGLIAGSFINVIAHRLPNNLPIVFSRSICPKCNIGIPLYRNIPLLSYIIQKRKCHHCDKVISCQYPLIEFVTAVVFFFGLKNYYNQEYILFIWISILLISIAIIDFKTLNIPIILLVFIFTGELIFLFFNTHQFNIMLLGCMFGVGYLGITFIVTSLIYKKQTLGYGDLLLISLLGIWLGPINILLCIFLSALTGLFIWIIKYFRKIDRLKLPFGTYLSLNAILLKILNLDIISYMTTI